MKKLIVLLFLFISMPTLAGDTHTQLDINVSDIVYALGKPDFTSNHHYAFWYHKYVFVVCEIALAGRDGCYMDKTLEELKVIVEKQTITMAIFKLINKIENK